MAKEKERVAPIDILMMRLTNILNQYNHKHGTRYTIKSLRDEGEDKWTLHVNPMVRVEDTASIRILLEEQDINFTGPMKSLEYAELGVTQIDLHWACIEEEHKQ